MKRSRAVLGSLVFFFVAPGVVAGVIPYLISRWTKGEHHHGLLVAAGLPLLVLGVGFLVHSFAQFVVEGSGTPAPIAPTNRLVVAGAFRFVRNPMYLAVLAAILGQAAIFGQVSVLIYAGLIAVAFVAFVDVYEEPTLRREYGRQYEDYVANVRAWVPRPTPWVRN